MYIEAQCSELWEGNFTDSFEMQSYWNKGFSPSLSDKITLNQAVEIVTLWLFRFGYETKSHSARNHLCSVETPNCRN